MTQEVNHISVCICTYKRPDFLKRLLNDLRHQETEGRFTYSIVVSDNDQLRSAEPLVSEFAATSSIAVKYCVEPQQSIARARNMAVQNATGDYIAFIDDDEFPAGDWLLNLFTTCEERHADGVLGPVKRHFDERPPKWVLKGSFYERPTHPTGHIIHWTGGRTGNVLIRRQVFTADACSFRPEFRAGEDKDFFRRMIEQGRVFIWCNEAVVHEVVPPIRWKRSVMLRRALLRGASARLQPDCGAWGITKSLIAVPAYAVALPFAALLGHHRFMDLLVRLFDHLGKLLALVRINPIREPYVTE